MNDHDLMLHNLRNHEARRIYRIAAFAITIFALLVQLAFYGGIAWVAWHFIAKWW